MSIAEILSDLKAGLARLDQAIAALEGSLSRRGRPQKTTHRKRTMSTAARKRISAAMKLRWAQRKGKSAPKKTAAPEKKVTNRKPMSAAARKKLSALAKVRWAERKKAGASSL